MAAAFNKAGWQAIRIENWTSSDRGVFIATVAGTPLPPEAEATVTAVLDAINIPHQTTTIRGEDINRVSPQHFQSDVLYLLVGAKP